MSVEQLDAVWNDPRIACPNRLVKWNTEKIGHSKFMEFGLWYTKGTKGRLKKSKNNLK